MTPFGLVSVILGGRYGYLGPEMTRNRRLTRHPGGEIKYLGPKMTRRGTLDAARPPREPSRRDPRARTPWGRPPAGSRSALRRPARPAGPPRAVGDRAASGPPRPRARGALRRPRAPPARRASAPAAPSRGLALPPPRPARPRTTRPRSAPPSARGGRRRAPRALPTRASVAAYHIQQLRVAQMTHRADPLPLRVVDADLGADVALVVVGEHGHLAAVREHRLDVGA